LLQLTWIDELLEQVKKLFTSLYGDQLKKQDASKIKCHFDDYFESRITQLEKNAGGFSRAVVNVNVPSTPNSAIVATKDAPPPMPGISRGILHYFVNTIWIYLTQV